VNLGCVDCGDTEAAITATGQCERCREQDRQHGERRRRGAFGLGQTVRAEAVPRGRAAERVLADERCARCDLAEKLTRTEAEANALHRRVRELEDELFRLRLRDANVAALIGLEGVRDTIMESMKRDAARAA
jgi:hypothetical protein